MIRNIMKCFLSLMFIFSLPIQADEIAESWVCTKTSYTNEVLVMAVAFSNKLTGSITVAGTVQSADYSVQGFNRRWDFGKVKENGALPYAFVITPDGTAIYYDFSMSVNGSSSPSQIMHCKQKE